MCRIGFGINPSLKPQINYLMKRTLLLMAGLLLSGFANAQDRVFTHTYQSTVLPLHARELEYWTTVRSGKQEYLENLLMSYLHG